MPLTERAKALTEAVLELFRDDREKASMVREDVLEFDANAGESSGDGVVLDVMGHVNDELQWSRKKNRGRFERNRDIVI
jgi:hypothetical protein